MHFPSRWDCTWEYIASLQLEFAQLCALKKAVRITGCFYLHCKQCHNRRGPEQPPLWEHGPVRSQGCWWNLQSSVVTDALVKLFI